MENQVNLDDGGFQQIDKSEINHQLAQKEPKLNYWMISTFALLTILVFFLSWFFLNYSSVQKKNNSGSILVNSSPTPVVTMEPSKSAVLTNTPIILKPGMPKYAAFMRRGEIYFKNFLNNQEIKVSKVQEVGVPNLSPNGKYVIYHDISTDIGGLVLGGFPRADVFLASTDGSFEKKIGYTNTGASKPLWSRDGNYLGIILFAEEVVSSENFFAEALLLDVSIQKELARPKIDLGERQIALSTDEYDVNIDCSSLETKYISFCEEFVAHAKTRIPFPSPNVWDKYFEEYKNSSYVKPGYGLSLAKTIGNDLVVLEFYSVPPDYPKTYLGIANGVFRPRYQGTTKAYTLLLNEKTGDVILELPEAVEVDFIF